MNNATKLIEGLRACADDPMWANHAEISKSLCSQSADLIERQAVQITQLEASINKLLAHCDDPECFTCGSAVCPHEEPLHFHHDGCPACIEAEYAAKETP